MNPLVNSFNNYIRDVAGDNSLSALVPSEESSKRLPIYLTLQYLTYDTLLFDYPYVLFFNKKDTNPTPGQIEKHHELASSRLTKPVVFVFDNLAAYARKRLIQKRINFVVPGRQAYIASMLVDLRERVLSPEIDGEQKPISAPAQTMILLRLLNPDETEAWPLHRWSDRLAYSRMSISRASKQLAKLGLCTLRGNGREVIVEFRKPGNELWTLALPHLTTPVKRLSNVRILRQELCHFPDAGLTALSRLSNLASPHTRVLAASESAFKSAVEEHILSVEPFSDSTTSVVERWRYSPSTLSETSDRVDRFSLYLSLVSDRDERIQAALDGLIQW